MDLGKLLNDIASQARPAAAEPPTATPRPPTAPETATAPAFTNLEQVLALDAEAAARIVDQLEPDTVIALLAGSEDRRLHTWLLGPLDDGSRQWVVKHAARLRPTRALLAEETTKVLALASSLQAAGRLEAPAPAPAGTAPAAAWPAAARFTAGVSFGAGAPAAAATVVKDDSAPEPTAADDDLRQHLARLVDLARLYGPAALAQVADEAPHPLLAAGLGLLSGQQPPGTLDEIWMDLRAQALATERARCDLILAALRAVRDGGSAEDFLAGS